jgi:hypothetical protein
MNKRLLFLWAILVIACFALLYWASEYWRSDVTGLLH